MSQVAITSILALRKHRKKLTKDESIVYNAYLECGPMTDNEVSSYLGKQEWPPSRVSARRNGLRSKNACELVRKRKCSITEENVNEWRAIEFKELKKTEPQVVKKQIEMFI